MFNRLVLIFHIIFAENILTLESKLRVVGNIEG